MEADLVPVEHRLTSDRKIQVYMMRKSYAAVKRNLTPDMEDACSEIETGFNCIAGNMGFPDSDLSRARGGSHGGFQEWALKLSDKVTGWRNEVDQKHTGTVIDYLVFGKTFNQIAFEKKKSRQTISGYFYEGLNEYVELYFK